MLNRKHVQKTGLRLSGFFAGVVVTLIVGFDDIYAAPEIGLSDAPAYSITGVPPNLIISLDNSKSMEHGYAPDGLSFLPLAFDETKRAQSSEHNKLFFDPSASYPPPKSYVAASDSWESWPDAAFEAAKLDPFSASTSTVDLRSAYRAPLSGTQTMQDPENPDLKSGPKPLWKRYTHRAYYFWWNQAKLVDTDGDGGVDADDAAGYCATETGRNDDLCYEREDVDDVETELKQSFANWYSYYRHRILALKTILSHVFAGLELDARLAYQDINNRSMSELSAINATALDGFISWTNNLQPSGSTPLHATLQSGASFLTDARVYRDNPAGADNDDNVARSCRKNFHILFTDGGWSTPDSGLSSAIKANVDGDAAGFDLPNKYDPGKVFDADTYTPMLPYRDANTGFLADAALYYWANDLNTEIANSVPPSIFRRTRDMDDDGDVDDFDIFWEPENDPANWQHIVTFTIGFGLAATDRDYESLFSQPFDSDDDKNDAFNDSVPPEKYTTEDLWHAAINSRGFFSRVDDPASLKAAFQQVLTSIGQSTGAGSAAAGALDSGSITSGSKIYQAKFDSNDWTGDVVAYLIETGDSNDPNSCGKSIGEICSKKWSAKSALDDLSLDDLADRKIFTFVPGAAVSGLALTADNYGSLAQAQRNYLRNADNDDRPFDNDDVSLVKARINYLRGDDLGRAETGDTEYAFRARVSRLADMINSNPVYEGTPGRVYTFDNYPTFRDDTASVKNRKKALYVGANDGMLHAFDVDDEGKELFAYVPNAVFPNLAALSDPDYDHENYVDGPLTIGDVYTGATYGDSALASNWKTVLVGALGKGGQGIYALDVTDPDNFSAEDVLWEFTDNDDRDLGYTYGRPVIARIQPDDEDHPYWAAIVANGYNNTEGYTNCADRGDARRCPHSVTGDAVLYVIKISDGTLVSAISTDWGTLKDPLFADNDSKRANGLADPAVVDLNNDFIADVAYAGDLHGNLWKFNLHSLSVSYGAPIFSAETDDLAPVPQPITEGVAVTRHPTGMGTLVMFGTGKFLGGDDSTDSTKQSFYAIWDNGANYEAVGGNRIDHDDLLKQTITTYTDKVANADVRVVSNASINWTNKKGWYMNLPETRERVHQPPQVRDNRLVFLTLTPGGDPCAAGGNSWVMAVDARDGSALGDTAFDVNRDGLFGESDMLDLDGNEVPETMVSGIRYDSSGIYSGPSALVLEGGETMNYISTSDGDLITIKESSDLQWRTWSEIR